MQLKLTIPWEWVVDVVDLKRMRVLKFSFYTVFNAKLFISWLPWHGTCWIPLQFHCLLIWIGYCARQSSIDVNDPYTHPRNAFISGLSSGNYNHPVFLWCDAGINELFRNMMQMEDSERCQLSLTDHDHNSLILPKKDFNRTRQTRPFTIIIIIAWQTNGNLNHWGSFTNVEQPTMFLPFLSIVPIQLL